MYSEFYLTFSLYIVFCLCIFTVVTFFWGQKIDSDDVKNFKRVLVSARLTERIKSLSLRPVSAAPGRAEGRRAMSACSG